MWKYDFDQVEALEYPRIMSEIFEFEDLASSLEEELERELAPTHPLKGYRFSVLAKNMNNPNEFVFETNHEDYSLIKVHLTWKSESELSFPNIEKFDEKI